ncbi:HTH-type transcriptional regulator/antitoxin HigA [Devosia sp. UYZn731]|uniref:ImmA/IrrE family metallo-endopeptidase n=1 Tax=Devosia sp. UYZn731 TaxID=3156345 RepID=UPI0033923220
MTDPNWASPPGDTIVRIMKNREIGASDLADALGMSAADFDMLLDGRRRLSQSEADVLAENLGSTPRFWLARDKSYVVEMARLDQQGEPASETSWIDSMPTSSMRKLGWIPKESRSKNKLKQELLAFFGCDTLQEWGQRYSSGVGAVAFRTSVSLSSDGMATLVWLRVGEQLAANQIAEPFDRQAFKRILPSLKKLSAFKRPTSFLPRLIDACASVGVSVVTAKTPEGCRASGASWFDAAGRPVLLLSFRHLSEDHFWFTFFHEAAHVILHGENHIDGEGGVAMGTDTAKQEREANDFAQETLFSTELREALLAGSLRPKAIMESARAANVTAGIVVGQLEKLGIVPHGKMNFLKHRYRWGDSPYVPDLIG